MYVRVGLYFLDIILGIALIQRLPKLGNGLSSDLQQRVVRDEWSTDSWPQRDDNIRHLNPVCAEMGFWRLLGLKIPASRRTSRH